jgi:hypothetical protein
VREALERFGDEQLLLQTGQNKQPLDWAAGVRFLLFRTTQPNVDLWVLPMSDNRIANARSPKHLPQTWRASSRRTENGLQCPSVEAG